MAGGGTRFGRDHLGHDVRSLGRRLVHRLSSRADRAAFALAAGALVPPALGPGTLAMALGRPVAAVLGLSGVAAYYGMQNLGLLYTTAGTAALLQAALPVATAALAALVLRERVPGRVLAGLVLTTAGVALVSTAGAQLDGGAAIIIWGHLCDRLGDGAHGSDHAVRLVALERIGLAGPVGVGDDCTFARVRR